MSVAYEIQVTATGLVTINHPSAHCLAKAIFNDISGVTMKPCKPCFAIPAWRSSAYSMNATFLPLIKRASWKPGYCRKSIVSIISFTSAGRFSTNNTLDGCWPSPSLDQTSLLEAWVLPEKHRKHHLVHLSR